MVSPPSSPTRSSSPIPPPIHNLQTPVDFPPSSPTPSSSYISSDGSSASMEKEQLPPIHVVTEANQLPVDFLRPSPQAILIVGLDSEILSDRTLCLLKLAFPDAIYLVDAIDGGKVLIEACKPALESEFVTKVIHDGKRTFEVLYYEFGIKLDNVVDTQIAYSLLEEQEGQKKSPDDNISLDDLLADRRYCGLSDVDKEEVRVLLRQDPNFWTKRPLSDQMIYYAAADVHFLVHVYHQMMEKSERPLQDLVVRGSLYCRRFSVNSNDPPIPGENILEEDGDYFDTLPAELVLLILRSLTSNEAFGVRILSKRWFNLWREIPWLTFLGRFHCEEDVLDFTTEVMNKTANWFALQIKLVDFELSVDYPPQLSITV
ncbi:hypothetical protein P8452_05705 [Trifolium repens]|nr:hypothetical protein P8452_05705 [Trifolium repens]